MIMLANREKTRLMYTIGYGYNPEHREYLENIEFHLDNPNSRGAFVVSFRNQTPLLINNIDEITKDFSPRSVEFAKKMGTHSFICVPIVFKGESMGVLVVDNIRSKRLLSQSDMSLLMGIAPQIAISINNAMAYRKIAESEKKFRSLSESTPDIIYTIDKGRFHLCQSRLGEDPGSPCRRCSREDFIDFLRKEEIPVFSSLFKNTRDGEHTVQNVIGTLLHKDGSDRFFSISGAPNLDSEGRVIGVVGTFKDVTDIVLSEAKLKQSFEKLQTPWTAPSRRSPRSLNRETPTLGSPGAGCALATAIAGEMGLPRHLIDSIQMAATLHDVGKINVPAEILSKPKHLSEIEMSMSPHALRGWLQYPRANRLSRTPSPRSLLSTTNGWTVPDTPQG